MAISQSCCNQVDLTSQQLRKEGLQVRAGGSEEQSPTAKGVWLWWPPEGRGPLITQPAGTLWGRQSPRDENIHPVPSKWWCFLGKEASVPSSSSQQEEDHDLRGGPPERCSPPGAHSLWWKTQGKRKRWGTGQAGSSRVLLAGGRVQKQGERMTGWSGDAAEAITACLGPGSRAAGHRGRQAPEGPTEHQE